MLSAYRRYSATPRPRLLKLAREVTEQSDIAHCDVLLTRSADKTLMLRYADCTPVLLADTRRPAVAALTVLAMVIFVAGVTGITWQWQRATGLAKEARGLAKGESAARTTAEQRELAASSEQMSKMSRSLLEAMDRFVLEGYRNGNGSNRKVGAAPKPEQKRVNAEVYAAASRS